MGGVSLSVVLERSLRPCFLQTDNKYTDTQKNSMEQFFRMASFAHLCTCPFSSRVFLGYPTRINFKYFFLIV